MAKELAHFKNFAKLKDTKVAFNDITVIAGKPGTGKSYVMKFMYAVNEVFYKKNTNSLLSFLIEADLNFLKRTLDIFVKDENEKTILINYLNNNNFSEFYNVIKSKLDKGLLPIIKSFINRLEEYYNMDDNSKMSFNLINILNSIFSNTNQIATSFLVKNNSFTASVKGNEIFLEIKNLLNSQEPIFVETPLILEFKKFMNRREGKTPYHIESLLNILDTDYSFTNKEQDKFIQNFREKSKIIIGGDIESTGDSFIFNREDDKNYDILNASSGTKSIGLLQYLVTNKALKKGSVLYWEEPEVHLHPSWQLKMVDLFVELMNAGVKIVFSTHSPFMADYLNAISKRNSYRDRISFNVLDEKDGVVTNHILNDDNWDILQKELMDSFEDILWQYL